MSLKYWHMFGKRKCFLDVLEVNPLQDILEIGSLKYCLCTYVFYKKNSFDFLLPGASGLCSGSSKDEEKKNTVINVADNRERTI